MLSMLFCTLAAHFFPPTLRRGVVQTKSFKALYLVDITLGSVSAEIQVEVWVFVDQPGTFGVHSEHEHLQTVLADKRFDHFE